MKNETRAFLAEKKKYSLDEFDGWHMAGESKRHFSNKPSIGAIR